MPLRTSGRFWAAIAGAGLFGGLVFGLVWESNYDAIAVLGYLGWQIPICLALAIGKTTHRSALGD